MPDKNPIEATTEVILRTTKNDKTKLDADTAKLAQDQKDADRHDATLSKIKNFGRKFALLLPVGTSSSQADEMEKRDNYKRRLPGDQDAITKDQAQLKIDQKAISELAALKLTLAPKDITGGHQVAHDAHEHGHSGSIPTHAAGINSSKKK